MFLNTNGDAIHTRSYGCIAYCRTDCAKEHLDLREFPAGLRDGAWAGLLLSINR